MDREGKEMGFGLDSKSGDGFRSSFSHKLICGLGQAPALPGLSGFFHLDGRST